MAALESRVVLSVDLPLAMRQAWSCLFHAAIGVLDEPVIIRGAGGRHAEPILDLHIVHSFVRLGKKISARKEVQPTALTRW
jgi:hypothetical protein